MSDKKDDWKVVSKSGGGIDPVGSGLGLFGLAYNKYEYTVEDKDGNQFTVNAADSKELGEKISNGDFKKK